MVFIYETIFFVGHLSPSCGSACKHGFVDYTWQNLIDQYV